MKSRVVAATVALVVAGVTAVGVYLALGRSPNPPTDQAVATTAPSESSPDATNAEGGPASSSTLPGAGPSATGPTTTGPDDTVGGANPGESSTTTTAVTQPPSIDGAFGVPATIDASCGSDVTDALNSWLKSLPNGTSGAPTVAAFGDGCFRIDGILLLDNRSWMILTAGDAVLNGSNHLGKTGDRHVDLVRSSNVTITGFEIVGAHAAAGSPEFPGWGCPNANGDCHGHHGIGIEGSSGISIIGNYIHNVYGDFIYVGLAPISGSKVSSSNILIKGNVLSGSGRQGVSIVAGIDVVVTGNTIGDARANLIDIEPANADAIIQSVSITGNTFGERRVAALALTGPGACGNFADVKFTGNTVQPSDSTWPSVYGTSPATCPPRTGLTVTGNQLEANDSGTAVDVTGWENVVVDSNTIVNVR